MLTLNYLLHLVIFYQGQCNVARQGCFVGDQTVSTLWKVNKETEVILSHLLIFTSSERTQIVG